eukprot:TRINITY_DN17636_c0_g1_i3.p1 TRINITY_DN17636_c0_g1~~TRINITY_DN17636_c0_g1_i3.p1  ORF type:complete len:344 (+),score=80.92 TRINITY_DN17636_c0_g1_i3:77-1033(+)
MDVMCERISNLTADKVVEKLKPRLEVDRKKTESMELEKKKEEIIEKGKLVFQRGWQKREDVESVANYLKVDPKGCEDKIAACGTLIGFWLNSGTARNINMEFWLNFELNEVKINYTELWSRAPQAIHNRMLATKDASEVPSLAELYEQQEKDFIKFRSRGSANIRKRGYKEKSTESGGKKARRENVQQKASEPLENDASPRLPKSQAHNKKNVFDGEECNIEVQNGRLVVLLSDGRKLAGRLNVNSMELSVQHSKLFGLIGDQEVPATFKNGVNSLVRFGEKYKEVLGANSNGDTDVEVKEEMFDPLEAFINSDIMHH